MPVKVVFKPVLTTPDAIAQLCREANNAPNCIGLICWMHTFSPAKMWIAGLTSLRKPFVHLHTQYNREIPWDRIDMDFMNLNQAAHGDREFGFICTRLRKNRAVVVGYWQDADVQDELGAWARAAAAWADAQGAKFARFGDNMREVAVTEGDKVEAQIRFGYSVNGYGVGDLVKHVEPGRPTPRPKSSSRNTRTRTRPGPASRRDAGANGLRAAAKIELGMRAFLTARRLQGLHHHLRRPARPGAASRARRAAADGRRLRLRRRRRLENRGPGARHEGHGRRTAAAARRSWKTTPTISSRAA